MTLIHQNQLEFIQTGNRLWDGLISFIKKKTTAFGIERENAAGLLSITIEDDKVDFRGSRLKKKKSKKTACISRLTSLGNRCAVGVSRGETEGDKKQDTNTRESKKKKKKRMTAKEEWQ